MMKRKEVLQRMKYAITSVGNYYPLDTVQNIQNSIDSFKNLREDLKAEAAKNIYNEAINARVSIPADNEIYRFVSLKEDAVDKGKVFECEYFYVSSSDLDDTDSFTDELDRMSTSINKAIGRSDVFKSYISVNQNDDTGKTFTTNLYTIYEDKGVYKFIKIANIEVTYYNKFTYSYEILATFDFDVNKVYRDEDKLENDTLSESFNIDRILNDNENVDFFYLGETSTKLLESLKPSDYGIPELKKFPMHDKKHVLLAIKFFNTYVGTKYEKELANNINKKIQEFKIPDSEIHMTKVNQFKKYYIPYKKETLDEGFEVKINSFSKAIDIPKVYHCSTINLGTQKYFVPRIPDGFDTTNGYEENKTKRICVSTKIELCILAMNPEDIKTGKKLYVYTPVDMNKVNDHLMKPDTNEVEDCDATEEYWITKQTKMKLIGVIQIGKKTKAYSRLWHSISREDGMTHELRYDYYYEWKWFNIQDKDEVDLYNKINPKKLYEEVEPLNFSKFRSDYNNECKKLYYTTLKRNDGTASMIDDEQKYFNITDAIKNTSGLSNELSCHPENLYGTHKDVFLYVYNNTTEDEKRFKPVYHGIITIHFRDEKDWDKNKDNFDWEWETKEDLGYDKESNEIINLYEVQNKTEEIDFLLNESHVLVNMYRLDQDNFDGKILQPKVPDNYYTRNGYEDNSTPRVCFAPDIKHCLRAMSCNCTGMEFYVHVPLSFYDAKSHLKRPLSKEVPDADITGEIWITRPVKLLCIGKIRVIKDAGEKGFKFKYGPHTAELYDWEWEWIEKYKNINESLLLSEDYNVFNEEKSLKSIVNTTVGIFRKHNLEPKFSKSELNKFLEKDEKLCFCGLGSNYNRITQACREANKTIKPLGYKITPDNYGTAWLKSLKPKNKSIDILNEAMFLNKKDLYLNYEEWNLGRTNILLITGLSGSGKSTLGMKEASTHKSEYIELDLFEQCYMFANEDQLKEAGLVFYDYLTKNRSLYEKLKQKQIRGEELGKEIAKFLNYVITYCESKPHTKFVIEGVQIYSFMKVDKAKCYPMIIKNTSALVSMLRRIKRSFKNGEVKNLKEFRNLEIVKMLSWYFGEEKVLEEFRKACKVVLESSTASLAVVPSNGIGSNPTQVVKTYDYINSHNMLKSYYDLKDDIKKSSLFNEAIITSPKTLYGYDRVKITKDIFERYTEELRKIGYNKEGMTFNEGDKGEFIFDKNKNIKGCILITKYIVNKIPVNVLRFIYIDDSICDDKHPKEKWFTSLYNISINKYSVACIEINKKDKYLMNEFITENGRTVLEDNGKTVLVSLDDELFNTDYKLVLNNSDKNEPVKGTAKEEIPLDETIVPENTLNEIGQIASLNKLGTTSGVNSKLGLWNPIVKIGNKNYRERCEALIFNDSGMVYLGVNINRIRIPGGGTHPNVLIEDQLVEECREEARINIKDIQYIGCYKNDYTDAHKEIYKKVNDLENVTYEGAITYLFIAKYDSKYTGEIKALDRDDLLQEGQFIPIAKALDYNLKNEWRVALNYYLGYVDKNEDSTIYDYSSKIISNEENFKTHFLELAISDYTKNIMTESYNILTEEASSNALKAKRKKIEKLVYGFFNMIDSTGKNAEKYKKHYDSLTDKQFFKEINDMLKDDKKNFYLEILPNINEPSLKKIKETADFLGLELDEYVYFRHDGDEHVPVRTPYKVPVGYLQIRRLRVKRFWLITRPKKLCIKL